MNRKIAPAIVDAIDFKLHLKPYDHYTLDNGVSVYSINTGSQDVVQLEIVFFAGSRFETQNGIAAACNFLLKNGTNKKTAFEISEVFDYYGAYCNRSCYSETAVLSLHTLSKHIDHVLPVMTEMLSDSIFPQSELDTYKQNSKQRLSVNLQKAEFVATRLIDSYVFGKEHPYGKYSSIEDIDALQLDAIKLFYEQYYKNGTAIVFVAGKLPADMDKKLNAAFGKLSLSAANTNSTSLIETTPSSQKQFRIQNDTQAVQGAIRLASAFPGRHHPDFKKIMLLNNIFGGFFGSRLMANIREDKGYTYGIYSYIQNHIQQTSWQISTEAGKDVAEATIEEVYNEMKLLRDTVVEEDELLLVKNYMIGSILGDLDGPFQIIARWKNIVLNNLDEAYFYDSLKAIKETPAEEIQSLAKKYLQPENFYELIVY